jgi:hypothetical protein
MTAYTKQIQVTDTGMVIARVFAPDGRRVSWETFGGASFFRKSPARVAKHIMDAHAWADSMLYVVEQGEVMPR